MSLEGGNKGVEWDQESFHDHEEGIDPDRLERAIRLGCTAGAPTVAVSALADVVEGFGELKEKHLRSEFGRYLDSMSATAVQLSGSNLDEMVEVVRVADRLVVVDFEFDEISRFEELCKAYIDEYWDSFGGQNILGGPGMMVTVSSLREAYRYMNYRAALMHGSSEVFKGFDEGFREGAKRLLNSQPLVVECSEMTGDDVVTLVYLAEAGDINGISFTSLDELKEFVDYWSNTLSTPLPHIIFKGNAQDVLNCIASGYYCDGFSIVEGESVEGVQNLNSYRLKILKDVVGQTVSSASPERKDGTIRIGVVALQGAYKLDAEMFRLAHEEMMNSGFLGIKLDIDYIVDGREIDKGDYDLLLMPGGWHAPQLEQYGVMGIVEATRRHIARGGDIALVCAGAIAGRDDEESRSKDVSNLEPMALGPYGVDNNALSGCVSVQIRESRDNGWNEEDTVDAVFVGAPALKPGEEFEVLARLPKPDKRAVLMRMKQDSGAVLHVSSMHSPYAAGVILRDVVSARMSPGLARLKNKVSMRKKSSSSDKLKSIEKNDDDFESENFNTYPEVPEFIREIIEQESTDGGGNGNGEAA